MTPCARDGCSQWAFGDDRHCSYDLKIRAGLITPDWATFGRKPWGTKAPVRRQGTVNAADVLTDEQMETARLMRAMGADERTIRRAITREREASRMPKNKKRGQGATTGTGVKGGRYTGP